MSARSIDSFRVEIALGLGLAHQRKTASDIEDLLDAYEAAMAHRLAEKIRAMNEGCGRTECVSCAHRSDAADLIDPEVAE